MEDRVEAGLTALAAALRGERSRGGSPKNVIASANASSAAVELALINRAWLPVSKKDAGKAAEKLGISAETVQIESRGSPVSDVILNDARRWRR